MDLRTLAVLVTLEARAHIPKHREEDHDENRDDTSSPMLSFAIDIHEAEKESSEPEEPFSKGCQDEGCH